MMYGIPVTFSNFIYRTGRWETLCGFSEKKKKMPPPGCLRKDKAKPEKIKWPIARKFNRHSKYFRRCAWLDHPAVSGQANSRTGIFGLLVQVRTKPEDFCDGKTDTKMHCLSWMRREWYRKKLSPSSGWFSDDSVYNGRNHDKEKNRLESRIFIQDLYSGRNTFHQRFGLNVPLPGENWLTLPEFAWVNFFFL